MIRFCWQTIACLGLIGCILLLLMRAEARREYRREIG